MTTNTPADSGQRSERWTARLNPTAWTATAWDAFERRVRGLRNDDRGDVPGWVLVTLMTAGLVTVIWALAKTSLQDVFTDAISHVKP
jgi:hypothetical protein